MSETRGILSLKCLDIFSGCWTSHFIKSLNPQPQHFRAVFAHHNSFAWPMFVWAFWCLLKEFNFEIQHSTWGLKAIWHNTLEKYFLELLTPCFDIEFKIFSNHNSDWFLDLKTFQYSSDSLSHLARAIWVGFLRLFMSVLWKSHKIHKVTQDLNPQPQNLETAQ